MILIGISGKKRTGKDTVCSLIMELTKPSWNSIKISFADSLKEECAKATGWTVEDCEAHKASFRMLWQWWGTEFRRKLHQDSYWISKALDKITNVSKDTQLVIIPDVRFLNEAKMIRECGGHLIRVNRNTGDAIDLHKSETELDEGFKFDYTIENVSSVEDLREKVRYIIRQISKQTTQYQYQKERQHKDVYPSKL